MGRALRLFITNLGGGAPGVSMMAVISANWDYSFMFAEDEEQSPWEPPNVEQVFKSGTIDGVVAGGDLATAMPRQCGPRPLLQVGASGRLNPDAASGIHCRVGRPGHFRDD